MATLVFGVIYILSPNFCHLGSCELVWYPPIFVVLVIRLLAASLMPQHISHMFSYLAIPISEASVLSEISVTSSKHNIGYIAVSGTHDHQASAHLLLLLPLSGKYLLTALTTQDYEACTNSSCHSNPLCK